MKKSITLILIMMLFAGCNEPQKWGDGEPSDDYIALFGNDNTARLNKVQNDFINRHDALFFGVDTVRDGKKFHQAGVIDMVIALQRQVEVLESADPNDAWQKKVEKRLLKLDKKIDKINGEIAEEKEVAGILAEGEDYLQISEMTVSLEPEEEAELTWSAITYVQDGSGEWVEAEVNRDD